MTARWFLLATLILPSCKPRVEPPAPRVPVSAEDGQALVDALQRDAQSVRRYQGFVRIRGKGPEGGFDARLVVVFERPGRLRVELLGAFGSTRWSAVATEDDITVLFPGPRQFVKEADVPDVVGRLLGLALSTPEVIDLLAGNGTTLSPFVEGYQQGSTKTLVLEDGAVVTVSEERQITETRTAGYRVRYPDWKRTGRQTPDQIQLETEELRATLTPESVDVNVPVAAEAFELRVPEDAARLRPADVGGEAVFVVTQER